MILELVRAQYFGTNCWIFALGKNMECFIIDPGMAIPDLVSDIAEVVERHNLKPIATIVTHGHVDHTFSVHAFDEKYGVATYIHPKDRAYLADPNGILTPGGPTLPILEAMGVTSFREPTDVRELLEGLDELRAAIGIPGVIKRVDADIDVPRLQDLGEAERERQEHRVSCGHVGDRDARFGAERAVLGDLEIGGQGAAADRTQIDVDDSERHVHGGGDAFGGLELEGVSLAISHGQRVRSEALDAGDGEAGARVESTGKEDHGLR